MKLSDISHDTSEFEVAAERNSNGQISEACARDICNLLDTQGFAAITNLLDREEADHGLSMVRRYLEDPARQKGDFASQTDMFYGRRDFCPLPSNTDVLSYAATFAQRLQPAISEYCGTTRKVLEISTMTSYRGASHQYIHRDPDGVLCLFAAVDHISPEQGGTVFVPGTHKFSGADMMFDGRADFLTRLYQAKCNYAILKHNLKTLWQLRKSATFKLDTQEWRDRVLSTRYDNHQPNLFRFILGKNSVFSFSLRTLLQIRKNRQALSKYFRLVQTAPSTGTVILYRSDMLHAGPDNKTDRPRYFFGMSIARDVMFDDQWREGYSPHETLLASQLDYGDLLNYKAADITEKHRAA
jgi:ectoine hydroxylase-related dioxygenase (phytanoyl-CoA dioxygenase family)